MKKLMMTLVLLLMTVAEGTTQNVSFGGVQLWENGPYWAECNVGATKPEECGYYFWWGDTVGYRRNANNDGWISVNDSTAFSFCEGNCPTHGKSNLQLQSDGYIDAAGNLLPIYDAAATHLGAPWRMPTGAEIDDLENNCTVTWINQNGVLGCRVSGKGAYATKSIFLPAAGMCESSRLELLGRMGFFWASSWWNDEYEEYYTACELEIWDSRICSSDGYVYKGRTVRPVRGESPSPQDTVPKYEVKFVANGASGSMANLACASNTVYVLTTCAFRSDKRFAGWACSNGRRYDDGMLVFDLAKPGETVTMTAIWE